MRAACQRLLLPQPSEGKHELFSGQVEGLTVQLKDWKFPQSLVNVAAQHENLQRDPGTEIDYVDVVIVANLQSYIGTSHPYNDLDWSSIPAFQRLGIEPEINIVDIEENQEDLQEVRSMLSF